MSSNMQEFHLHSFNADIATKTMSCSSPNVQQKIINSYWLRIHYCYLLIITAFFTTTIILMMLHSENVRLKLCTDVLLPFESEEQYQIPVHRELGNPITIHCNGGRLGNQMCTMATLYGLGKLNRRNIAALPCNYDKLSPIFDFNVSLINMTSFKETNHWTVAPYLRSIDHFIDRSSNIIKGYYYPCSYTFYHHIRNDIRKVFTFKPNIRTYAKDTLKNMSEFTDSVTVGIHVRRSDFLRSSKHGWLKVFEGREVDMEYFEKATDYFRDRYDRVTFLAVSDDRQWCRDNLERFGIQVAPDSPGPEYDMATLVNCDHLIMTYGTFGFWAGYLSGGTVTYFDKFLKPGTRFTTHEFLQDKMYLPEWVGIETNSSYKYHQTR